MILFSFILTERCDWNCKYCQFPYIKNPTDTNIDILRQHLPYLIKIMAKLKELNIPYIIEAQGGEPGLIEYDTMKYFLETLGESISISTNGLIMERGWLNGELTPYINEIMWHVCEAPNDFEVKDYENDDVFINRGIVHDNITEIQKFIGRNPHIDFNYVDLECDIQKAQTPFTTQHSSLYSAIEMFDNVTDSAKDRIKEKAKASKTTNRDDCKNLHASVIVNLANETLMLCQRVPQNNIPLNRNNVLKRIRNFPRDIFDGDTSGCKSCIRLYSDKFKTDSIETILRNRRIKF